LHVLLIPFSRSRRSNIALVFLLSEGRALLSFRLRSCYHFPFLLCEGFLLLRWCGVSRSCRVAFRISFAVLLFRYDSLPRAHFTNTRLERGEVFEDRLIIGSMILCVFLVNYGWVTKVPRTVKISATVESKVCIFVWSISRGNWICESV